MKKTVRMALGISGALFVMITGNVLCYQISMKQWEKRAELLTKKTFIQLEQGMEKSVSQQIDTALEKGKEEIIAANAEQNKLSIDTVYEIRKYREDKKTTSIDYETLPEELLGMGKKEMEAYCRGYMQKLPVEEYLDGLKSMGVVHFSKERVIVKKIYNPSNVKYRYYLVTIDGEVVVYYGDKKTVYEYTGIETKKLSKKEQGELKKGREVKDEDELFSLLENYSS